MTAAVFFLGARRTPSAMRFKLLSVLSSSALRFRAPFVGQQRIAAGNQPFARIFVRHRDFGQIAFVEQRGLQLAASHEILDLRRPQAGDPIEPSRLQILGNAGTRDHATVADEHHVGELETCFQFLNLCGQSCGIGGIALEHFDGNRRSIGCAQEAINDLRAIGTVVAGIAALRQFATTPLEITR